MPPGQYLPAERKTPSEHDGGGQQVRRPGADALGQSAEADGACALGWCGLGMREAGRHIPSLVERGQKSFEDVDLLLEGRDLRLLRGRQRGRRILQNLQLLAIHAEERLR